MQATIITIGDEILIGQVVDTNSAYMAGELNKIGVKVHQILSISDNTEDIISALDSVKMNSEIVLITGGLGPTKDDITKQALAQFFKCGMMTHQPTLEKVKKRMAQLGVKLSEINRAQADVPEKCLVLNNNSGSAPGMLFSEENTVFISMPGVPFEMKDIMRSEVIPYLKSNFELPFRFHKTFLTVGVAESILSERLNDFELNLPSNFSFAYLPSPAQVRLRLSAFGTNAEEIETRFSEYASQLETLLDVDLFGYNEDTLEAVVGKTLLENSLTIATAESCTGGNLAKIISSVPGASAYFKGSIVAYSNDIKMDLLSVSEENLCKYGAVSEQTAIEMAQNIKKVMGTNYGLSTSGIAGPTGGSEEKPVGTVWIGLATPTKTFAQKFNFGENRDRTVIRSTYAALNMLRKELKQNTI
jgi:nicotinamide-nucleotide amidase